MTRKDYILIADAMRSVRPRQNGADMLRWRIGCGDLAVKLFLDNARFNETKFLKACGIDT